jgi:pilus assembly protein CpaE
MKPQSSPDPFDLSFDADDEFGPAPATSDGDWREAAVEALTAAEDPFHDIPDPDPLEAFDEVLGARPEEPPTAEFVRANPVHEMIATAEQALGEAVMPRITIHVFYATPEVAEAVERAAGDRRMERASCNLRPGGLAAALETYQNQPTPSLVVVESVDAPQALLAGLDALAEVCDPGTKVLVIGAANDIAIYRELMRRGVSEYLVPPFDALHFVRTVGGLYADPSAPFMGRQVAFCGAKGGAGVSTLAHNVAHVITERLHTSAVLVDLDLPFGTAGLDFNQDPIQGVHDALTQPERLDPVLMDRMMARCTERLSLFAAPATLDTDYEIGPEAFEEVTQKIRGSAAFVILDLPHSWSSWKRKILVSSDDLVIVATPDLASLRNAKNMIDLVRRARPNDTPPRLVLNQVGLPGRPEIPVKDFAQALGVTPTAVIAFDAKLFGTAANNGQMVGEVSPKSKSAEALEMLAQQITRRDAPAVQQTSFLAKLMKRK